MSYFSHRFETTIQVHPVGTYNYTVVYLPAEIAAELPFSQSARLRVEADVSGVPVKGAWQPAKGRWYLMLPKAPLRHAGLTVGAAVEVAFRLTPQDEVDLPGDLKLMLSSEPTVQAAWKGLTPGKQRGLAHMVASAKRAETRGARLEQVRGILLGLLPEPWKRNTRARTSAKVS
ncbi:MAG TPA: YdeI/OmpD-associated family protein [Limnobacter sp.]|nr:YdeI/OmpD-associated family protein [Limnobacter sp.]